MDPIPEEAFAAIVDEALMTIPEDLRRRFDNVAVVVEDVDADDPDLLGVYEGVPLTERLDDAYVGSLPDRIVIFRLPLCDLCSDADELRHEIRVTVVHELAHHMGIDDQRLHELGWA